MAPTGPIDQDELLRLSGLAKLLAHPLRMRIAVAMSTDVVTSPSILADAFEANLGNVSYHIRKLAEGGALTIVDERPVRGAMEHFYALSPDTWSELIEFLGALRSSHHSALAPTTEWWWAVGVAPHWAPRSASC